MSISEAIRRGPDSKPIHAGQSVTLEGVANVGTDVFLKPGAQKIFIQDHEAGIALFTRSPIVSIREGDVIHATGSILVYNGMLELGLQEGKITAHGRGPAPIPVTPEDLITNRFSGRLVQVDGVVTGISRRNDLNITIGAGTSLVHVYLTERQAATFPRLALKPGTTLRVIGIPSQRDPDPPYDDGWQLLPRVPSDVTVVAGPTRFTLRELVFPSVGIVILVLSMIGWSFALRKRLRLLQEAEGLREQLEVAERLAALGRVASTMAHEFNNVLMSIQAFHQVTQRMGTFEQFMKSAPTIDRAILRGKTVTDGVLRLTRASTPALKTINFSAWLRAFESDLVALVPANIEIAVACEPDLFVAADVRALEQVLINLALNASQAMNEGGKLTITAARDVRDDRAMVHVTVADTGCGMTEDVQRRVFEPLFTTRSAGTGLGLAIVHAIVRAHGGSITVESTPGKGTRFHWFMKIAAPSALEATLPAKDPTRHVRKIALIEDDDAVAEGVTLLLKLSNFEVRRVSLGREAVPLISEFKPDAVVLDVGLPDMDGLSVFRLIEKHAPTMPMVFATGHADEALLGEVTNLPHVGFIRKPFEIDDLIAEIEKIIDSDDDLPARSPQRARS